MRARVPLDVDLEDRIVYGLTPVRLAYVVVAGLAALAIWESRLGFAAARGAATALVVAVGALLAWGRWRDRAADAWLIDFLVFVAGTRRLKWSRPRASPPEDNHEQAA